MIWYQVAFDEEAVPSSTQWRGRQWVVLRMTFNGRYVMPVEHSRWPTKHEAEGHARKVWEALR